MSAAVQIESRRESHARLLTFRDRVNELLSKQLTDLPAAPERLLEAMRYALLTPGKRIRPLLTYASAECFGLALEAVDDAAMAVEIIHAYSLIHDDLPAMDDDDLRRGRPTCHKAFDEATAILAGDALQAFAFELLAQIDSSASQRLRMIKILAQACGPAGMAGGQAIDLAAVGQDLSLQQLMHMHRLKTGALIRAAVLMPASLAGVDDANLEALTTYGDRIGLAFQIRDDILDVTGDPEVTGKKSGADQALEKPTFPSLIGVDSSNRMMHELIEESVSAVECLNDPTLLVALARYIVSRDS